MLKPRSILVIFLTSLTISVGWRLYTTTQFFLFLEYLLYALTAVQAGRYVFVRIRNNASSAALRTTPIQWLAMFNTWIFAGSVVAALQIGLVKGSITEHYYIGLTVFHLMLLGTNLLLAVALRREHPWLPMHGVFSFAWLLLASNFVTLASDPPLPESVVLHPPLAGSFVMINGGNNRLQNAHYGAHPSYYLGIFAAGEEPFRGAGLTDAEHFAQTFGTPVLAPAEGTILETVSGLPDMPPGEQDFAHPLGNHVVLKLKNGYYVYLTNLQQDSISVAVGESVRIGQPIAAVGFSGRTGQSSLFLVVTDHPSLFDPLVTSIPFYLTGVVRRGDEHRSGPFFPRRNDVYIPHASP